MLVLGGILGALTACKTTEANYRAAYEKAVADNDRDVTPFEATIYNRIRSQMREQTYTLEGKEIKTYSIRVKVTEDGGGIREWLKRYNLVVAEFKQVFNARSMRQRLVDSGFPRTFIVENGEPYYYIIVDSTNDLGEAAAFADSIRAEGNFPLPLKDGFPYILEMP